ncbi:unnamed protein product, partial [Scytosiphon promiscuus]
QAAAVVTVFCPLCSLLRRLETKASSIQVEFRRSHAFHAAHTFATVCSFPGIPLGVGTRKQMGVDRSSHRAVWHCTDAQKAIWHKTGDQDAACGLVPREKHHYYFLQDWMPQTQ